MSTISPRQTVLLVMLFVATCIAFIALDNRRALEPLRSGLHSLALPAIEMIDRVLGRDGPPQTELQRRYDELQARYDALQADYAQAQVIAQEVDQLRALLKLQQEQPKLQFVSARVLYPDPTGIEKFVIIDKGSADGIQTGMAVTDPNYFVGLVTEVAEHTARVTLAIDAKQAIGAQLMDTGGVGIAWGMWQRGARMEMRHVDRDVSTKPGELVITACKTEAKTARVPCGLVIGKVDGEPVMDNQGDAQTIPVLPAADFESLSVVAVIVADDREQGS
jgi:rod shape-determining protein MreC